MILMTRLIIGSIFLLRDDGLCTEYKRGPEFGGIGSAAYTHGQILDGRL